jgi:hypothetical protein
MPEVMRQTGELLGNQFKFLLAYPEGLQDRDAPLATTIKLTELERGFYARRVQRFEYDMIETCKAACGGFGGKK